MYKYVTFINSLITNAYGVLKYFQKVEFLFFVNIHWILDEYTNEHSTYKKTNIMHVEMHIQWIYKNVYLSDFCIFIEYS